MNIEEAKRVCWLKSNPRPLGELLDEGLLGREQLEWASKWAYNPQLKEAAQILLQEIQNEHQKGPVESTSSTRIFELKMTLEQARAISWPFAPYKGQPIGTLLDSKKIVLKDLAYAIENARDQRVKHAATALTLARLEQEVLEPPKPKGPARIISGGRSFAERRQMQLSFLDGSITGFALGCFVITILIMAFGGANRQPHQSLGNILNSPNSILMTALALIIVILLTIAPLYFLDLIEKRLDKLITAYRRGQEGEEKVLRTILQVLDGDWCAFHNLCLPGYRGNLDVVLIGPSGIWVLEVKNLAGWHRNIGNRWEYQSKGKWKPAFTNPSVQAIKNAARLSAFLKADHINIFVNPAVVWVNQENQPHIENPSVPVWLYDNLTEEVGNIWQAEKLSADERERIIAKLAKLCHQSK